MYIYSVEVENPGGSDASGKGENWREVDDNRFGAEYGDERADEEREDKLSYEDHRVDNRQVGAQTAVENFWTRRRRLRALLQLMFIF